MTYTPVLASDGADLAAAILTIRAIGDGSALADAIDHTFPGSRLKVDRERGELLLHQHRLLRPLGPPELSDGTLHYLLLASALLSPTPPELMVVNEPEASLHPSLMAPLAQLLRLASQHGQIILVSHNEALIEAIRSEGEVQKIQLEKSFGETSMQDASAPHWEWPKLSQRAAA